MNLIKTEERLGKPIAARGNFIVPVEKITKIQPPGMGGVGLWRRPSAVVVQHPDGRDELIPIQDPTHQAIFSLWGLGLAAALLMIVVKLILQMAKCE